MDEQIRALQEYVYIKYVEVCGRMDLDEEAAVRVLEEYYVRPEQQSDPECVYVGILAFELGYEIEEKQVEYFRNAKYWLDRHRPSPARSGTRSTTACVDLDEFFEEHGIEVEATARCRPTPTVCAPVVVEEVDDHGPMMLDPGRHASSSGRQRRGQPRPPSTSTSSR